MKNNLLSYKTFVYPLDAIGNPAVFLTIYLFAIISVAIENVLDWFMFLLLSIMCLISVLAIALMERKIYEIVCIDSTGIRTIKTSFLPKE